MFFHISLFNAMCDFLYVFAYNEKLSQFSHAFLSDLSVSVVKNPVVENAKVELAEIAGAIAKDPQAILHIKSLKPRSEFNDFIAL